MWPDAPFQLLIIAQQGALLVPENGDGAADAVRAAADGAAASAMDPTANLAYLVAAVLFILGLKGMTHPRTAVRGNLLGAVGMLIAVVVTVVRLGALSAGAATIAMAIGAAAGFTMALRVQMTQMPQMVALFNGFGGLASLLVAGAEVLKGWATEFSLPEVNVVALRGTAEQVQEAIAARAAGADPQVASFAAALTGLIGAVTFTGSMVAACKLVELSLFKKPWSFPGQQLVNAVLLTVCLVLALLMSGGVGWPYLFIVLAAGALGVLLVVPIGGADMPVVIALLNSYSGLAAAAAGFVISNTVLIIAGSLVGASGLILTSIMCRAMNRSLANVLFGKMDAGSTLLADDVYEGKVKATSPEEVAMMLDGVRRVVVVPGYGMAVAQAQHAVRELYNLLEERGTEVEFAIHPVAGRMPGHMNVLLAEADIPYDKLKEMDDVNPTFSQTDMAIVIGANDVVNPLANTDPKSPIAGMPILEVGDARTVVVIKRSLSPGFAGIPNPLFAADNCLMLFEDGKKAVVDIVAGLKEAA